MEFREGNLLINQKLFFVVYQHIWGKWSRPQFHLIHLTFNSIYSSGKSRSLLCKTELSGRFEGHVGAFQNPNNAQARSHHSVISSLRTPSFNIIQQYQTFRRKKVRFRSWPGKNSTKTSWRSCTRSCLALLSFSLSWKISTIFCICSFTWEGQNGALWSLHYLHLADALIQSGLLFFFFFF